MSMMSMPLLIKVPMTKENFISLLGAASKLYKKSYLKESYKYDGQYFELYTCEMDWQPSKEAELIAKFASPTDAQVGLICSGEGCSFSWSFNDLYFKDGKLEIRYNALGNTEPPNEGAWWNKTEATFRAHMALFLSGFPVMKAMEDDSIKEAVAVKIEYSQYRCVGMSSDVLREILKQAGHQVAHIHFDMGCVSFSCEDDDEDEDGADIDTDAILAQHFNAKKATVFCADTDQEFPDEIMVLLFD